MAKTSLVVNALTLMGLTFGFSLSQATEVLEPAECLQSDTLSFKNCLNEVVVKDQLVKSQAVFAGTVGRLTLGFDLSSNVIQKSFDTAYGIQNNIPAIEVGSINYEADDEGVDFTPSGPNNKNRAAKVENNIRRTMNFAAWYHARSFGRTSSILFSFRRVEIQASRSTAVGMTLKDKTLLVSLPQTRLVTTKELINFWNSGRVLVPSDVAQYPMPIIKVLAGYGEKGILGEKVLEYWNFINPVGEFRVGLHALYLGKVVEAKGLIERENLSREEKNRMVSFLENPVETAKSLDSLFSLGSSDSKKGVVVVNRTTGFCAIKVSNSHVINVSVKASRFAGAPTASEAVTVKTENGATVVESDGAVPVHIVNDKTYAGLVCVDTHDNVDVSLDVVFGQFEQQLSPETLVKYAKSFAL